MVHHSVHYVSLGQIINRTGNARGMRDSGGAYAGPWRMRDSYSANFTSSAVIASIIGTVTSPTAVAAFNELQYL